MCLHGGWCNNRECYCIIRVHHIKPAKCAINLISYMISNQSDGKSGGRGGGVVRPDPQFWLAAVLQVSVCCAVSFMSGSSAHFWVAQSLFVLIWWTCEWSWSWDTCSYIVSLWVGAIPNSDCFAMSQLWCRIFFFLYFFFQIGDVRFEVGVDKELPNSPTFFNRLSPENSVKYQFTNYSAPAPSSSFFKLPDSCI